MTAPGPLGDRYVVRGVLGRGGMAQVYDAWDVRLDRPVAVKLLHPPFAADPATRRRFAVEARAAAALNHPGIVAVHDSGLHGDVPYIVMERLPGESLADRLARHPLPPPAVRAMLLDLLDALAHAHAAGVLHRDVKPGNILFGADGRAKIADFGVAQVDQAGATLAGNVMGTGAYLSPERLAGAPATPADDVYSLGVVGWEALTGRRMFPHENLVALARAICDDRPPPLAELRPDLDPSLVAVVDRATAPRVAARFTSTDQMRAALVAGTSMPVAPLPPVARPGRPRRGPLIAVVLAAVLALLALVALLVAIVARDNGSLARGLVGRDGKVETVSCAVAPEVPPVGLEPTTCGLKVRSSTN